MKYVRVAHGILVASRGANYYYNQFYKEILSEPSSYNLHNPRGMMYDGAYGC